MGYFNVIPGSNKFFGKEALTYRFNGPIKPGTIVVIELNKNSCFGIATAKVEKPEFETKDILETTNYILNTSSLNFINSLLNYYPNYIGPMINLFLPNKLIDSKSTNQEISAQELKLSKEQARVIKEIENSQSSTVILHGITGSGKTRIYIDQAVKMLKDNKSSLVMVPEISLTPKMIEDFERILGKENLIVYHSKLTPVQRNKIWSDLYHNPKIIIGPRSILYLPTKNLGLIVVDEFHDQSYNQENQPTYNAVKVAGLLSKNKDAKLILGSATPNVTDYYQASSKDSTIINLNDKAILSDHLVKVEVIDVKSEEERTSINATLSNTLIQEIKKALSNKKQILVFINRRGTSRTILCNNCGWQSLCKHCNIPHVFHHDLNKYLCHECGRNQEKITRCPECNSEQIFYKTAGTKLIEKELSRLFPFANIARFDKDNNKADHISSRYSDIRSGDIDIIIGTQILIKGHDFPKLGLVAMLQADSYLQYPDYTSKENLYQAISQLFGRIDRGHSSGKFLVQTHSPDNPIIDQAVENRWDEFYKSELEVRQKYNYPPFVYVLKVKHSLKNQTKLIEYFENMVEKTKSSHNVLVDGPTPCLHQNKDGKWHYQIIIKAKNRSTLLEIIKELPNNCLYTIDPSHLL